MFRFITTLLLLTISVSAVAEDTPVPQTLDELKIAIEKIQQEAKVPAIGIAIIDKSGPQWIAGLGEANTETHSKADENTLFRIGSTSKMFAAMAILQLVEQGKVSLDTPIRQLIPEVIYENPWEETHPIRLVHLLEHTTGWDDLHVAEYAFQAPDTMSTLDGLNYHPDSRVSRWIPGTRMSYCNAGPAVAAYIVEKLTQQRFEDFVAAQFFTPLGMDSTSYFLTQDYLERGATLYTGEKAETYWHIVMRAAGSINSSPKDMAQFLTFFISRGNSPHGQLLSPTSIERMETPMSTPGYKKGITAGYGLANYTSGYKNYGIAFHGHNGGVLGGLTDLSYQPDLGVGYVLMLNSSDWSSFDRISKLIRSYLLKDQSPPTLDPLPLTASFKAMEGYYLPLNSRIEIMTAMLPIAGIMKITADEFYLHREPLLGGWEKPSTDYALNEDYLIDAWTGLPSITWVEDPLAGKVLQVSGDILKPISVVEAFGWLVFFSILAMISLLSVLYAIFWLPYRLWKKIPIDSAFNLKFWPMLTSAILFAWLGALTAFGTDIALLATPNTITVSLLLLSLIYPLCTMASVVKIYQCRHHAQSKWLGLYSKTLTMLHIIATVYFIYFGLIGFRTWG